MTDSYYDDSEASWKQVKDALLRHGFEEVKKDSDDVIFFTRGPRIVRVPKENRLYIISLLDIVQQSGIHREDFFATLRTSGD
ncbi:MAG: hypothetical protein LVO36_01290 [Nitrosopumilus sp. (ex Thoosa mismalolli)]|nr:hypothetical protein [Nitrosopumilus sp. (ex Thoosa mismalolli)]